MDSRPSSPAKEVELRLIHLWGIAVGASIGGDYMGWNSCLESGLGGAIVGLIISFLLYTSLCLCIAEMAAHSTSVNGAHSFLLESLGPLAAYMTGIAELIKIIITGAICVESIGAYVSSGLGMDSNIKFVSWISAYTIFSLLNIVGLELSMNFQVVVTLSSIAVLCAFYVPAVTVMDFQQYALMGLGFEGLFSGDISTLFLSLPYSLWWFLGMESVPLLFNQTRKPAVTLPRAIVISIITLTILSILTLFLNSSVAPGVIHLKKSESPLLDGFKAISEKTAFVLAFSIMILVGLIVSFHSFVLYAGDQVAALARDGILPRWLSHKHTRFQTPARALISSSILGLIILAIFVYSMDGENAMPVLIHVAVIGGLVSYIFQLLAYLSRPWSASLPGRRAGAAAAASPEHKFQSPLGKPGAIIGLFLSIGLLACAIYQAIIQRSHAIGLLLAVSIFAVSLIFYYIRPPTMLLASIDADRTAHEEEEEEGILEEGGEAGGIEGKFEGDALSCSSEGQANETTLSDEVSSFILQSPGHNKDRLASPAKRRANSGMGRHT